MSQSIKIVVAGGCKTGKSALVNKYLRNAEYDPEIQETHDKKIEHNGKILDLEIVDTVNFDFHTEQEYSRLYQSADCIILTYSIDDINTFKYIPLKFAKLSINIEDGKKWILADDKITLFAPIILVGTKADKEYSRQVSRALSQKMVDELALDGYMECSNQSEAGIDKIFDKAIELGLQYQEAETDYTQLYGGFDDIKVENSTEDVTVNRKNQVVAVEKSKDVAPNHENSQKQDINAQSKVISSTNSNSYRSPKKTAKDNCEKSHSSCCVIM